MMMMMMNDDDDDMMIYATIFRRTLRRNVVREKHVFQHRRFFQCKFMKLLHSWSCPFTGGSDFSS